MLAYERVQVKAGRFLAFKIKNEQRYSAQSRGVRYFWYAPEVEYYVKLQYAPSESIPADWWNNSRDYELIYISRPKPQK